MTARLPPRDLAHELTVAQLRQQAHDYRLAARDLAQLAEEADARASRLARAGGGAEMDEPRACPECGSDDFDTFSDDDFDGGLMVWEECWACGWWRDVTPEPVAAIGEEA